VAGEHGGGPLGAPGVVHADEQDGRLGCHQDCHRRVSSCGSGEPVRTNHAEREQLPACRC
jgi:hypothetical protein